MKEKSVIRSVDIVLPSGLWSACVMSGSIYKREWVLDELKGNMIEDRIARYRIGNVERKLLELTGKKHNGSSLTT